MRKQKQLRNRNSRKNLAQNQNEKRNNISTETKKPGTDSEETKASKKSSNKPTLESNTWHDNRKRCGTKTEDKTRKMLTSPLKLSAE